MEDSVEINIKYQNIKLGIVEREKTLKFKNDAHMADVVRFLKSSVPKVKKKFLKKKFLFGLKLFLEWFDCLCKY